MANDKIQVIMLMDVKNIGRKNEVLNVSPSYAKNVLLAKQYAVIATPALLAKLTNAQTKKQDNHNDLISQLEEMVQILKQNGHTIKGNTSPAGKLYAKIDNKTIASSLSQTYDFTVDPTIIKSDKIDHSGEYEVKIAFEKIKSSFVLTVEGTN